MIVFIYELADVEMRGNNENKRISSPETVHIHLKMMMMIIDDMILHLFQSYFSHIKTMGG